jgi:hypothetical protein
MSVGGSLTSRLYIIGNGFDLHHGMPSRFSDFGRYLHSAAPDVARLIRSYLCVDEDFWNCFEERLSSFDADAVIDYAGQYLGSYGADDWSDSGHHDFEYETERIVDGLSGKLIVKFKEWIGSLRVPSVGSVDLVRLVDPQSRFLTFNYTPTLQVLYGVPDSHVLHIHGRYSDPESEIVLGHGWERRPDELLHRQVDERTDTRLAGGYQLIDDYFAATFKPTAALIERYRTQLDSLSDISEIIVLGHSLAEVDAPYLRAIIERTSRLVTWTVSCYQEPSLEIARLAALGVSAQNATFAPLSTL